MVLILKLVELKVVAIFSKRKFSLNQYYWTQDKKVLPAKSFKSFIHSWKLAVQKLFCPLYIY